MLHRQFDFFSAYVNFTKDWRRLTKNWVPHHHLISCHSLWSPQTYLLTVTWILQGRLVSITRFPNSFCEVSRHLPYHFPLKAKISLFRTRWSNKHNVNISVFYPWRLNQAFSEFFVWGWYREILRWSFFTSSSGILTMTQHFFYNKEIWQLSFPPLFSHCLMVHSGSIVSATNVWLLLPWR